MTTKVFVVVVVVAEVTLRQIKNCHHRHHKVIEALHIPKCIQQQVAAVNTDAQGHLLLLNLRFIIIITVLVLQVQLKSKINHHHHHHRPRHRRLLIIVIMRDHHHHHAILLLLHPRCAPKETA